MTFGAGLGRYVLLGLLLGVGALVAVSYAIFRLGRRLPVRAFLTVAVVILMATSVTFLGNAIRSLQEADVVRLTTLSGWPRAPIFLAQALGYWPSKETLVAQGALAAVYVAGAVYMFVVRPRLHRAPSRVPATTAS